MHDFKLSLPEILLRVALALSFLYPPIAALTDADSWLGYFPAFLLGMAGTNEMLMLHAFGVLEALLALWILFGRRVFIPATIAAVVLLAIVILNLPQFSILFRDVSIALAAIALAIMHRPSKA